MRINKILATCGVASRRSADVMIENGEVKINIKNCLMWKYMRHKPRVNPHKNHGLWTIIICHCRFINVTNVPLWWGC